MLKRGAAGLLALLVLHLGSARAFCHLGALGLAQPHRGALQARSLRPRASPGLLHPPGGLHRLQARAPAGHGEEKVGPVKLQTAYLIAGGTTALAWLGCALAALATYKPWRYTHNTIGVLQALTALPLIWASFYGLATASREGIFRLRLPDCRRLNVRVYLCIIFIWASAWPTKCLTFHLCDHTSSGSQQPPFGARSRSGSRQLSHQHWCAQWTPSSIHSHSGRRQCSRICAQLRCASTHGAGLS